MQRLIDANALMDRLSKKKSEPAKVRYTEGFNDALMRFRSMIHGAPTVDAAPVVHGVWVGIDDEPYEVFECSECGTTYDTVGNTWDIPNYCPNCGAKMD